MGRSTNEARERARAALAEGGIDAACARDEGVEDRGRVLGPGHERHEGGQAGEIAKARRGPVRGQVGAQCGVARHTRPGLQGILRGARVRCQCELCELCEPCELCALRELSTSAQRETAWLVPTLAPGRWRLQHRLARWHGSYACMCSPPSTTGAIVLRVSAWTGYA